MEEKEMTGTALVVVNDDSLLVLENVDRKRYEELQGQAGVEVDHFGRVSSVIWNEQEIDWEYGY
ncbi:hypothetical protein ACFDTO_25460 [Microbacteriaceae bacterium 4G12]